MTERPNCPKCGKPMVLGPKASSGKTRWMCIGPRPERTYCYSTTDPTAPAKSVRRAPKFAQQLTGAEIVVITAAQNATPVHAGFFAALQGYCKARGARLVVVPLRYKNPTSRWTGSQRNEEVWAPEVEPFLHNKRSKLNANLVLMGDVKVQPTAVTPLTGFEALTHGESGILAHTKLQLRTIATPQSKLPKILTTTGAVTVPNYTDSRAGKQGAFHHTLGACVVEISGKTFHMRQINAKNDGSFIDLDREYLPSGSNRKAARALALVTGDTHVDFADPAVVEATYGKNGIVAMLRPQHLVYHDLLDGYAVNPHHGSNVFSAIAKLQDGRQNIAREVERACLFVKEHTPLDSYAVIVPSNHDDFLRRWIVNTDWRNDPHNALFYLQTAQVMVEQTILTPSGVKHPSPFVYWARHILRDMGDRLKALDCDESLMLAGVELGMHGDRGPNGARGSVMNLRRLGVKSIIGHSHTPGIEEGCYQVGTSTKLRLEYNAGPSSWLNTHCVLYANGKRSLINIINGAWRL